MWPNSTLDQMARKAREMDEAIADHARELRQIKDEADAKVASALAELDIVKKNTRSLAPVAKARRELLGT